MSDLTNYRVVLKDEDGALMCVLCQHEDNDSAVKHRDEHAKQLAEHRFSGKVEIEH